jgi:fucose permease
MTFAPAPAHLPVARKRPIAFAYYAAILLEGTMLAVIGPTLDALEGQTGSTTEQISILFTANALGYIAGSLLAGRIIGRLPGNAVVAAALGVMAAAAALVPVLGSLWMLVVAFVVIGLPLGLVDVGTNTLLAWLFPRGLAPWMNALHLAFGIGAFLTPLLVDRFAVVAGDAAAAYWLFAGLMVPTALWLLSVPHPEPPGGSGGERRVSVVRAHLLFFGLMAAFYVLHVGAELGFGGWIYSYAEELQIGGETTARVLNSVFWGGLVVGRLAAIPISMRVAPGTMVVADLVGAGLGLALIALLPDWPPALWIGTVIFGMSLASVFASGINYTGERIGVTGAVMSILVVGGGVGSMTFPWAIGQLFDRQGPESMLWVVGGAIAGALALFLVIRAAAPAGPGRDGTRLPFRPEP